MLEQVTHLVDDAAEASTGPGASRDSERTLGQRTPTDEIGILPLGKREVAFWGEHDHAPSSARSTISLRSSALGRTTVNRTSMRRFAARSASVSWNLVAGLVSA